MPHWSQSRPAASIHVMLACAEEEFGLARGVCIEGAGLPDEALLDPGYEIGGKQELRVLRNILRALPPDAPFALEAGLRYRVTTHGMWGLAILTSSCLREALEVGARYWSLSLSFNTNSFELDANQVRFIYDSSDNPEDLQAALVERDMGALIRLERDVLGHTLPIDAIQVQWDCPPYADAYRRLLGVEPTWNGETTFVAMDVRHLDVSGPLADGLAQRACEEQCRALLERRGARAGLAGEVRLRLMRDQGRFPGMAEVARELGVSVRTLRNRLNREGTSFRQVVDEVRATLAEQLLAGELTLSSIAERLGYADTSSFVSAFRRWKGVPPSSYRRARGRGPKER